MNNNDTCRILSRQLGNCRLTPSNDNARSGGDCKIQRVSREKKHPRSKIPIEERLKTKLRMNSSKKTHTIQHQHQTERAMCVIQSIRLAGDDRGRQTRRRGQPSVRYDADVAAAAPVDTSTLLLAPLCHNIRFSCCCYVCNY
jgi:hypothetical protein